MIILYSDTLQEIIQPKLNEISSYGIDKYINEIPDDKKYLLPFNYEDSDIDEYKNECIKYLEIIIKRFNNNNDNPVLFLKRQMSMECSDDSHAILEELYHHHKIIKDDIATLEIISLIKLINYSLLFNNDNIIYYTDNYNNLDLDRILGINLVFDENDHSEKKAGGYERIGHSVCCFTCGGTNYYYDSNGVVYKDTEMKTIEYIYDQQKIIVFDWKKFLFKHRHENILEFNHNLSIEIQQLYQNGAKLPFVNPILVSIHYIYLGKNTNEYEYFKNDTLFFDLLQNYENDKTIKILSKSLFIERLNRIKELNDDEFICELDNIISDIELYDISGETLLTTIVKEDLFSTIYTKIKKLRLLNRLNRLINQSNLPNKYHYHSEHPLFLIYHKNKAFFNSFIIDFKRMISINDVIDNHNNTILHLAIKNNDIEAIKILLMYDDILLNMKGENNDTSLHLAFLNGNLNIINLLLTNIKKNKEKYKRGIEYKNFRNNTPIDLIKKTPLEKYNQILKLYNETNSFLKKK
jgi:ankyrin repeat protein